MFCINFKTVFTIILVGYYIFYNSKGSHVMSKARYNSKEIEIQILYIHNYTIFALGIVGAALKRQFRRNGAERRNPEKPYPTGGEDII